MRDAGERRGWSAAVAVSGALLSLLLLGAAPAGAEVLFNQVDETSPQSINSQDFNPANDAFDAVTADDFVVPPGETWQPSFVLARGTNSGATPAGTARVIIFADAGGTPGPEISSAVGPVSGYPRMEIPFAGPTLAPGTYWLGVQAILDPGTVAPANQWFWAENSEQAGSRAVYRNPGDGFGTGCTSFTLKSSCVFAGDGPHLAPDQSFRIDGTRTVAAPPPPADDPACDAATAKLAKAKAKLKKAKAKLADAEGRAKDAAKAKVKRAKAKVKKAKAAVAEEC
jgi:hypothetical protein